MPDTDETPDPETHEGADRGDQEAEEAAGVKSGAEALEDDALAPAGSETVQTAQEKVQEVADQLEEDYDEVPDLFLDLKIDETTAEFYLDALPRIRKVLDHRNGKAQFYVHREPNDDLYLMLGPKPSEFKTQWVQMQNPNTGPEAFERYADDLLEAVLLYPRYGEIDWQLSGDGMKTPMSMTKQRLVNTFFFYETHDPQQPHTAQFDESHVEDGAEIARSEKPSL